MNLLEILASGWDKTLIGARRQREGESWGRGGGLKENVTYHRR